MYSLVDMQRDECRCPLGAVDGRVPVLWIEAPSVPWGKGAIDTTGNAGEGDRVELGRLDP